MVLRRLSGRTENTSPVLTLITQFGGGKTHTLTSLYHLARAGAGASQLPGVGDLLNDAGITKAPDARVGVFVGNAWDPQDGRETPWIDVARQLAGEKGVKELGPAAKTTPPGTEAIARVFKAANAPVLLLFDEVLNFLNRHRGLAEPFHAFIQNLTVATTATTHGAAVISLPRSQIEMTDWDMQWQDHQGGPARCPGFDRQRRGGNQRSDPAAAFRGHRQRPPTEEGIEGVCRLVLRASRPVTVRMDGGGQRHNGEQGQGIFAHPF